MVAIEIAHLVAILIAFGGAFANAISQLCIRIGTSEGRAYDAVYVAILVNIILLSPIVGILYFPDYGFTWISLVSFVAAGLFGTVIGRAFAYTSIDRIGASRTAPIAASNALVAAILGVVILGEQMTEVHAIGIGLVVVGVAALSWETSQENPDNLSRRELVIGLFLPIGAAFAYGIEPIFASIGFEQGTPAPVGLVVKTIAAIIGFTAYLRWRHSLPSIRQLRSDNTRWFIAAGVGNTLFLLAYYLALELAPVSVVTPIIITYTLFIVVISAIFMPQRLERITWRLVGAAVLVVVGAIAITAFG